MSAWDLRDLVDRRRGMHALTLAIMLEAAYGMGWENRWYCSSQWRWPFLTPAEMNPHAPR